MTELTEKCRRCEGSGEEIAGDGIRRRSCPSCKGLGLSLSDEGSNFVHALLRDDDVYYWIRQLVEKIKGDIKGS